MSFILQPWHIVLLVLSAMIDGERDKAIDYLLMESQVLREKLAYPMQGTLRRNAQLLLPRCRVVSIVATPRKSVRELPPISLFSTDPASHAHINSNIDPNMTPY